MHIRRCLLASAILAAACGGEGNQRPRATGAHIDSLQVDSVVAIKKALLNEVMTSTQFVNDLEADLGSLQSRDTRNGNHRAPTADERRAIAERMHELIARLDSSAARVAVLRDRAAKLPKRDSSLVAQAAEYEKTIAMLRETVARRDRP